MQPLRKWLQALCALRAIVECAGPSDQQVESRETSRVDIIDELPQGVETLIANVASDSLDGLDFIEHQTKPRMP